MKRLVFIFSMMVTTAAYAQPGTAIDWEKNYGGTDTEVSLDIKHTSDGGYIVVGYTDSNDGDVSGNNGGDYDGWVIKISATGSLQWQKALGGTGDDRFFKVVELQDGSFIVGGYTNSTDGSISNNHGEYDTWLVKLSSTGSLQWEKCYGGTDDDYFKDISVTSDGGYIVSTASYSNDGDVTGHHGVTVNADFWVFKLLQNGNLDWQKSLGGSEYDFANAIKQTSNGGYIAIGASKSNDGDVSNNHGNYDLWAVRLSSTGNIQWEKSMGGTELDEAYDVVETSDGGYVFAGQSYSNDGDITGHNGTTATRDFWIVKTSSTGLIDWQKSLGGTDDEWANDIRLTNSGDFIISGTSKSNDGDVSGHHGAIGTGDYCVFQLSPSGSVIWQKSYGGTGDDYCNGLDLTPDEGIVLTGNTTSNDGDVGGNHNANNDFWVVKLEGTLSVKSLNEALPIVISPNPATDNITIEGADIARAEVYDAVGKLVLSTEHTNTLSITALSKGMYMIKLAAEDGAGYYSGRIIKE